MFRRFAREPAAMAGLVFLLLVTLAAVFASQLAPYGPNAQDLSHVNAGPSTVHLLGTDDLGRDILSRLMYGARLSLRAAFQIVGMAFVIALPLGLMAGFIRGWFEAFLMRVMDAVFAFPPLVLALTVTAMLGTNFNNATIAIAIVFVPGFVRLIRGEVISVREETYIGAARSLGASTRRQITRHALPNVASPLIVQVALALGFGLLAEAGLSFLGLAEQPPTPSWGTMFQEAYHFIYQTGWPLLPPGLAIILTVLAFNMVADGLRDAYGRERFKELKHTEGSRLSGLRRLEAGLARRRTEPELPAASSATSDGPLVTSDGLPELLRVRRLRVEFRHQGGWLPVVEDVGFDVMPGETVGLVGESGSGKTVSALAVMGLIPRREGRVAAGSVTFAGIDLLEATPDRLRSLRGNELSMVFQEPMTSLNPAYSVGNQIAEQVRAHRRCSRAEAWEAAVGMLERVGIPDPRHRASDYPHSFSGGMRQRVVIAMALSCDPRLLIADEPTTALDVTTQAQILELLRDLQRDNGMAVVFVSHDLGVIAEIADRVAVLYAGQVVEQAAVEALFARPHHPYTEALIASMPQLTPSGSPMRVIPGQVPGPAELPRGCRFHPRCTYAEHRCTRAPVALEPSGAGSDGRLSRCVRRDELHLHGAVWSEEEPGGAAPRRVPSPAPEPLLRVQGLSKSFPVRTGLLRRVTGLVRAVNGVDLTVASGRTLGLVGESGSGKSTLARVVLRLVEPTAGSVWFQDRELTGVAERELRRLRRSVQIVFQDPYSSLDPKMTVADIVGEPLTIHEGITGARRDDRVTELLDQVGMGGFGLRRYPHEFSGGQRQRIAIARALALRPKLLVCDEPVSALDVSTQSQVLNLFAELQERLGVAYLFIAHDLSVVRHISDRIAVMYLGSVVEEGTSDQVCTRPAHPYTAALLSAVPRPRDNGRSRERIVLSGEVANPLDPPAGCPFHPRCPHVMDICRTVEPPPYRTPEGTTVACHLHTTGPRLAGRSVASLVAPGVSG